MILPTDYVARLWATRRVGIFLLDEIRIPRRKPGELRDEAHRFGRGPLLGIVTPYTAYLNRSKTRIGGGECQWTERSMQA